MNMTQCDFKQKSLRPLFFHQALMEFRLFCVTSRRVSGSKPCRLFGSLGAVTTETSAMSSANPSRSLGNVSLIMVKALERVNVGNISENYEKCQPFSCEITLSNQ